jgi:Uma2 family endonuclease
MLEAPQALLDERRRLGLDRRDEMWDGVLHVVPPPKGPHQRLATDFLLVAGPLAQRRGLIAQYETALFRAADDYRVPDQVYFRPEHDSERGVEGAELVVEVRSPGDETYEKVDFYAAQGVREMLVLHPDGRFAELFRATGVRLERVEPDSDGALTSEVLGIRLRPAGGRLEITWEGGSAQV